MRPNENEKYEAQEEQDNMDYEAKMIDLTEPTADSSWWKPAAGEVIGGVVESAGLAVTQFGEQHVLRLITNAGVVSRAMNACLQREIVANGVCVGDEIGIKYLGKRTGRSGWKFNAYAVKVFSSNGGPLIRFDQPPGDSMPADEEAPPPDASTFEDDVPL